MEKFWIVVRQGGNGAKRTGRFHQHDNTKEAFAEARRLASKEAGDFFVFECVGHVPARETSEPPE